MATTSEPMGFNCIFTFCYIQGFRCIPNGLYFLMLSFAPLTQLLVQFVQNTSIPLGQGLVESEAKDITCLSLLPVTEASECGRLMLPGKNYPYSLEIG